MSRNGRRHVASRRRRAGAPTIPYFPWRRIESPYPPLDILEPAQIEAIHDASMEILEEMGIQVLSPRALEVLARGGVEVDRGTGVVRFDRGLIAELVAKAPEQVSVTPRNPARRLTIGGRHINFSLVSGPPNVHDCERGRRSGNYRDYCDLVRLMHSLEIIHCLGNQPVAPIDLPAPSRHLDCYLADVIYTDRAYNCTAIGAERVLDGIDIAAIARGVTRADLIASPAVMTNINVNSPRLLDNAMCEGLMAMAEWGQPVVVTPFTLMGAMTPITLAAALAQQNAEALAGIALAQLVRPGTPVVYGAFTSNVDMRTGAPAFGTPENAKATVVAGQLARRYGLPYRASNANASNVADAQAVYESQMSLWSAILGHANIIFHGAGWLEGGLCASFEK
ncbi:MAG: methyltransferase, partial [Alphaproteobacteria bacterium]